MKAHKKPSSNPELKELILPFSFVILAILIIFGGISIYIINKSRQRQAEISHIKYPQATSPEAQIDSKTLRDESNQYRIVFSDEQELEAKLIFKQQNQELYSFNKEIHILDQNGKEKDINQLVANKELHLESLSYLPNREMCFNESGNVIYEFDEDNLHSKSAYFVTFCQTENDQNGRTIISTKRPDVQIDCKSK